jgi:glycosyltransferase involved in cell wall biosynthesis
MVWTEELARRLRAFGVPDRAIRVAPPGVDLPLYSPDPEPVAAGEAPELLFLAHNPRLKGLRAGLAALGVARRSGLAVRLAVVGRGPHGPWRRFAARLGLAGAVTFEGPLPPQDVVRRGGGDRRG